MMLGDKCLQHVFAALASLEMRRAADLLVAQAHSTVIVRVENVAGPGCRRQPTGTVTYSAPSNFVNVSSNHALT